MLLRLAYLGITNAFALLRLLPGSDRDKDAEILALRHQLAVLQRQLGERRVRFDPADRAWLAALLHGFPRPVLHNLRLLVRPDTVLRWHRNLIARRHAAASRPRRRGRPPTVRSVRELVVRLVADNPVVAENSVRAGQAACSYSRRMPPRRSRRWMFRWASRSGSVIGSGSGTSGRAFAMPWCGLCSL
jgi:hypothetical protein